MSDILTLEEFKGSEHQSNPHCLLLGHPVGHSLSPIMHNTAARFYDLNLRYMAVDVDPSEMSRLPTLLNSDKFTGANITIPYKRELFPYVDKKSEAAETIGAMNTIYKENAELIGCNTDAYGFSVPLQQYKDQLIGERAVIFGTGGASRAVTFALSRLGIGNIIMISRHPRRFKNEEWNADITCVGYDSWSAYAEEAALIVNTTPLGMEPDTDASPIRETEQSVLSDKICYDIVYSPRETKFLRLAKEAGGTPIGGLDMLIHQGSRSFEYWTGKSFPVELIKRKLHDVL